MSNAHPSPLHFVEGSFSFKPAEWFSQHAEGFKLRAPVEAQDGLIGPLRGTGYCLEPLGRDGDVRWFDPNLPAEHGDLVLVELGEDVLAGIIERNRHRPEWVATYGENPGRLACKVLAAVGGSWLLVTNESCFPLEGSRILGTCRKVQRDGADIYAPAVAQIATGAATVIYSDTMASIGPSGGSTNPLEIAITEAGVFEISVSALFTVSTFSGAGNLFVSLTAPGSSGSFTEIIWTNYPVTALNQRIEAILKNTYVTSGSGPWNIRFGFVDSGAGNTFTGTQLSMRVTVVRR